MLAPFFKRKEQDGTDRAVPASGAAAPEKPVHASQAAQAVEEQVEEQPARPAAPSAAPSGRMDKLSLDLLGAAEQIIQAKLLAEQKISELQDRLHQAGGHIDRLNRDIRNLDQMVGERDQSIADLEQRLAGKNLKVDQVLEDYRELQRAMSAEIEGLKGMLDMEGTKYRTLLQKHNDTVAEHAAKRNELEERIAKLEIENGHLNSKVESQRQEKAYLDRMINDFTSRMTAPFEKGAKPRSNHPEGSGEL
ncbi:hypothetical protein [Gorillibacterium sp. sgz5001074]|uniref:hypothetical protein n=1 Tax=Gorillibacterium sp. sgz5001074 TaxID=3446695 RepID=UPI003F6741D9